jgi:hypothetical protein
MKSEARMVDLYNKFMGLGKQTEAVVSELRELWKTTLPSLPVPSDEQFDRWLRPSDGDPEHLIYGMAQCARRLTCKNFNDPQHHLQFVSAVALAYLNERERAA